MKTLETGQLTWTPERDHSRFTLRFSRNFDHIRFINQVFLSFTLDIQTWTFNLDIKMEHQREMG